MLALRVTTQKIRDLFFLPGTKNKLFRQGQKVRNGGDGGGRLIYPVTNRTTHH